jgi:hypothetical protein
MSYLQAAADRMKSLSKAGLPKAPTVQTFIQKAAASLSEGADAPEEIDELIPFLETCKGTAVGGLKRGDLNRLLRGVWCEDRFDDLGHDALQRADVDERRSTDAAVIEGYLNWFPQNRSVMLTLSECADRVAKRHDWAWKARATGWMMFDPCKGPDLVGSALIAQNVNATSGSVAKIVKLEHAWRRLDGRNDDGFQVAPFPG